MHFLVVVFRTGCFLKRLRRDPHWRGGNTQRKITVVCTLQSPLGNDSKANSSLQTATHTHHNLFRVSHDCQTRTEPPGLGDSFLMFYALAANPLMWFDYNEHSHLTAFTLTEKCCLSATLFLLLLMLYNMVLGISASLFFFKCTAFYQKVNLKCFCGSVSSRCNTKTVRIFVMTLKSSASLNI